MKRYSLSHLTDGVLLRELSDLVALDRATTAEMLAHLAEVDARKLYLPAAYPSMFAWCVGELRFSEDAAYKRIQAARAARRFPAIFAAVADGRLHLAGACLLAPHLTHDTADDLLAAAAGKSKAEIERLLAGRFPRPDVPTAVRALMPGSSGGELAPGQVGSGFMTQDLPDEATEARMSPAVALPSLDGRSVEHDRAAGTLPVASAGGPGTPQLAPGQVGTLAAPASRADQRTAHAPAHVGPRDRLAPLAATRFALQATIGRETHDLLRQAQALLGHAVPAGDLDQVLNRALKLLVRDLERRRFAATPRPRPARRRSAQPGRHVPAEVRRQVWQRDGGRCTFVSDSGHRCPARTRLEFDHVMPYARGGEATAAGLRLRCRAHNQHVADQAFGAGFMDRKRREARLRSAAARDASQAAARLGERSTVGVRGAAATAPSASSPDTEIIPWLRALGFRADEARRAAEHGAGMSGAPLEERARKAIAFLAPASARRAVRAGGAMAGGGG